MTIDEFYSEIDKSEFYLGMVTQVFKDHIVLQVENLSLLSHRELGNDSLIPNTINYYVIVETIKGLVFGETYQSKIASSNNIHFVNKDEIWPEISISVLGILANGEESFKLPGTLTAGITDKVYIANNKVIDKYFNTCETLNVSNNNEKKLSCFAVLASNEQEIAYRPSTLFNKHLMIVGATNSGKSTSALSILDKLIKQKIKVLIIDPTGEYKTAFKGDKNVTRLELGKNTRISVDKLSMQNWESLFETNGSSQPAVLASAILSLRHQAAIGKPNNCYVKEKKNPLKVKKELLDTSDHKDFNLKKLPEQIINESVKIDKGKYVSDDFTRNSNQFLIEKVNYKIENTSFLEFFGLTKEGNDLFNKIETFVTESNTSLYLDCSNIRISDLIGGAIIDLISNYIINLKKEEIKPFVFFIDEVHRYTRKGSDLDNDFYSGLTAIAREGRKKGVFLFLTTQNPNDVDKVLLGQMGTLLIHRLTHNDEISAIKNHLTKKEVAQINKLETGEAILTSANLLTDVILRIRKCEGRIQDNETPSLVENND